MEQIWLACLGVIKDIAITVAAIGGVIVASKGLRTWRKQLKGNTEYELSRRLLRGIFKTRDAIHQLRNPFISTGELERSTKDAGYSSEEIEKKLGGVGSMRAVYESRWRAVIQARSDLEIEMLEAEVLWGGTIKDRLKPLNNCVYDLRVKIVRYLEHMDSALLSDLNEQGDGDAFNKKLQQAVEYVEEFIKPRLKI